MSFKDKKPNTIPEGYYYNSSEMDVYLAIVEPKAEKWDKYTLDGKNITPEIIEQIEELEQKLEAVNKFLRLADKEVVYDLGASQYLDNQMNQIQQMCRKATDETDEKALTALPHRILQTLGIPTCPACGFVASKSPCKYCGNDTGMEEGTG